MMLSTYYRQQHYHPVFTLRSSISLLIQVPFFIAAYHFLSHYQFMAPLTNSDICPFLFIPDLNKPDTLFSIANIPIHLLPIIMTLINIVAGIVYTKGFPAKEKKQLYVMAILFLVLLYNSPAALVLYWTCNNIFSLVKHCLKKTKYSMHIFYVLCTALSLLAAAYIVFLSEKTPIKKAVITCAALFITMLPLILRFIKFIVYNFLSALEKQPKKERFCLSVACAHSFCSAVFLYRPHLFPHPPKNFLLSTLIQIRCN